jgi:glycosyltransferase involved in cell wall biosynthesis
MKVSVVTVAFNAAATLNDAIESVARQSHPEVSHWVIDGGSTDGSVGLLHRYRTQLAGWISEPDEGLYDAMNKGVRLCGGEVLAFLNADDWYAGPTVLEQVSLEFEKGADLVYGNLTFVEESPPFSVRRIWKDHDAGTDDFARGWCPAHPATFIKRSLFEAAGGFDTRWKIAADYALMSRVMRTPGVRLCYLPVEVARMRLGGASTADWRAVWRSNRECAKALSENGYPQPWRTVAMKLARKLPQVAAARMRGREEIPPLWRPWDPTPPAPAQAC